MAEELNLSLLVDELRLLPGETEWVEFKHNNDGAETIAQDISALANSAARLDVPHAYMVWGIADGTHDVLGTDFRYRKARRGGEELENWLHHMLSPNASFRFYELEYQGFDLVVLQVEPARGHTVDFESVAYVRIGSYTKKLKAYPFVESEVWRRITHASFELDAASEGLSLEGVLDAIDYPKYFALLKTPMPQSHAEIIRDLKEDGIVVRREDGLYTVTNLGALLLASDLFKFPTVSRKALRIIQYRGNTKTSMLRERTSTRGYAVDYESAIEFIMALIPSDEPIVSGVRGQVTQYPEITIRENLANMLIHQDLSVSGSGPLVEIFKDRIDFTNPGVSLVETLRLVDNPPRSRNEKLASLMRRFGICEEAGSGWDKIIGACEEHAMPAPRVVNFESNDGSMCVSLYPHTTFAMMDAEERMMACYWHACMCFMEQEAMSNSSLRKRFGGDAPSASTVSRLIHDAVEARLIKPVDPDTAPRYMRYVPFWA